MITGIGVASSLAEAIAAGPGRVHADHATPADESLRRWRAQVSQSLIVLSERQQAVDALPPGGLTASCHADNLALLLIPAGPGPSPERPGQYLKNFAVATCVRLLNRSNSFGQRVALDDQFGAVYSMACKVPYEKFHDATILHPDMGIQMRHRSKEFGRPTLDDNKQRLVQICNACFPTVCGPDLWANEECDLCGKGGKPSKKLRKCCLCLMVYHDGCCDTVCACAMADGAAMPSLDVPLPTFMDGIVLCSLCDRLR